MVKKKKKKKGCKIAAWQWYRVFCRNIAVFCIFGTLQCVLGWLAGFAFLSSRNTHTPHTHTANSLKRNPLFSHVSNSNTLPIIILSFSFCN